MALRKFLSLRRPRSGRLEGRMVLIHLSAAFMTSAGTYTGRLCPEPLLGKGQDLVRPPTSSKAA
jgi:hypothetical protein